MSWNKINFNAQNILHETGKASLIKMPNNSKYNGYQFWHPTKLIRSEGGNGYFMSFSFTEEFEFTLRKMGKGKHNKSDIIDEINVDYKQIEEAFGIVNEQTKSDSESSNESFIDVKEPTKINKEVEVRQELINE